MGNQTSTIASAVGSWVRGIVAHLVALIIAPMVTQVSQRPPPPHPLQAEIDVLVELVNGLNRQVEILCEDLAARQEPFAYEMTIRAVPPPPPRRRRRRGPADNTE